MIRKYAFLLISLILSAQCGFAQELVSVSDGRMEQTTQAITRTVLFKLNEELSTSIIAGEESAPVVSTVKLIQVNTESEDILVSIEDKNRNDVRSKFRTINDRLYAGNQKGEYWVRVIDFGQKKEQTVKVLIDTDPTPGPTPPDPKPPTPPEPEPEPTPAPVKELTVLVVFESANVLNMPQPQREILQSTEFRSWLNSKCFIEPTTRQPSYRFFDQHTVFPVNCDTVWCKLMAGQREQIPWLIIADGNRPVHQGPLPATVAETKTLIERFTNVQRSK